MRCFAAVAVGVAVAFAVGGCASVHVETESKDYYSRLRALTDGADDISAAVRQRLTAAPAVPVEEGLAGVTFGSSMQQVIDVWGRPERIWMQHNGVVQLSIYASSFEFTGGRLTSISVHSVDLPALTLADGKLAMDQPVPDLLALFPGSVKVGDDEPVTEIELPGGVLLSVNEMDGQVISIGLENTVTRPE